MQRNLQVQKKKKRINSEKIIWLILLLILLAIPVASVYTKAILSESNIKLEETKSVIKKQQSLNDGLKMEISELASLDKIQNIAIEKGLTYQNGNIKVVTNE